MNEQVQNPNDYKVVSFHNSTDFGFTSEMGCMYDGRAINGKNGLPGIEAGETIILPYHIGNRLAVNLAKRVLNTSPAATVDKAGIPTGEPIWSESRLQELAKSYITDLYSEAKPAMQTETDKLMAKVEEYKALVDKLVANQSVPSQPQTPVITQTDNDKKDPMGKGTPPGFMDRQELFTELDKRGIKHDKRKSNAELLKLLV